MRAGEGDISTRFGERNEQTGTKGKVGTCEGTLGPVCVHQIWGEACMGTWRPLQAAVGNLVDGSGA